ncbi:hypothetical protein J2X01_003095 [Arthrobacter ginsengisoli]|uniref:Uncharacterized protein n=1 Tax=Arthrobacter ginsengisoli TaxID=1356565 RepID=A0ABU1UF79_9MICC|nr:hypothetical protein [Arthrobacter ginsengisoli]
MGVAGRFAPPIQRRWLGPGVAGVQPQWQAIFIRFEYSGLADTHSSVCAAFPSAS